jgi:hypothetical protein
MYTFQGNPLNVQVTLKDPATILGFMEQSAADTFFHPEIMATALANYARGLGYRVK